MRSRDWQYAVNCFGCSVVAVVVKVVEAVDMLIEMIVSMSEEEDSRSLCMPADFK